MPTQDFTASFTSTSAAFENHPDGLWPKISIELAADPATGIFSVRKFQVRPSEISAEAEVLYTRVPLTLAKIGRCSLHIEGADDVFGFRFEPFPRESEQRLLYRAKLFRKLKYIEKVFRVKFTLPQEILPVQAGAIDFVFRGITEGEFVTRGQDLTLPLQPSEIDLTKPPFNGPGPLTYLYADEIHDLLDHHLLIGPTLVELRQAEMANPQAVRQIQQGQPGPVWVRFDVLDHQITCRLENKAARPRKQLQQRLDQFKRELAREDPPELVELVSEPLMNDVSPQEAGQIAVGWLYYNHLPDRFCPQEPELDQAAANWRVPIYLVYADGQGGPVGELVIDKKTGVVLSHTPVEELRHRGLALATALLHVS